LVFLPGILGIELQKHFLFDLGAIELLRTVLDRETMNPAIC
jgi:hypothetical protein